MCAFNSTPFLNREVTGKLNTSSDPNGESYRQHRSHPEVAREERRGKGSALP